MKYDRYIYIWYICKNCPTCGGRFASANCNYSCIMQCTSTEVFQVQKKIVTQCLKKRKKVFTKKVLESPTCGAHFASTNCNYALCNARPQKCLEVRKLVAPLDLIRFSSWMACFSNHSHHKRREFIYLKLYIGPAMLNNWHFTGI